MKKFRCFAGIVAALAVPCALADTHALIMTIGQYRDGVPPLSGVQYDGESAKVIARSMGVKEQNLRHYKDEELTLDGMQKAFDDLFARVGDNDQVFIYYSGHGGRQIVQDPEERCAESLVTIDRQGFTDARMEVELPLRRRHHALGCHARREAVLAQVLRAQRGGRLQQAHQRHHAQDPVADPLVHARGQQLHLYRGGAR